METLYVCIEEQQSSEIGFASDSENKLQYFLRCLKHHTTKDQKQIDHDNNVQDKIKVLNQNNNCKGVSKMNKHYLRPDISNIQRKKNICIEKPLKLDKYDARSFFFQNPQKIVPLQKQMTLEKKTIGKTKQLHA